MELVPSVEDRPVHPFSIAIPDPFPVELEEEMYRHLFFISGVDLSTPGVAPLIRRATTDPPPSSEEGDEVDEKKVPGSPSVE